MKDIRPPSVLLFKRSAHLTRLLEFSSVATANRENNDELNSEVG